MDIFATLHPLELAHLLQRWMTTNISISSIQAGSSISLILYDEFGNNIYESVFNTSSSCLTIEIPSEIIEEANTIKITLNGADYIGEIY